MELGVSVVPSTTSPAGWILEAAAEWYCMGGERGEIAFLD